MIVQCEQLSTGAWGDAVTRVISAQKNFLAKRERIPPGSPTVLQTVPALVRGHFCLPGQDSDLLKSGKMRVPSDVARTLVSAGSRLVSTLVPRPTTSADGVSAR